MFDLPSPYADGSLKYDYPEGRMYLFGSFYVPEYFYKMLETLNIALVSTLIGFAFGFMLCFLAASNLVPNAGCAVSSRRFMEILRAFPEIVIAGFFLAILSIGPDRRPSSPSALHTIGALGKLFFEVVENIDMKPTRACGPSAPTGSSASGSASCRRSCRISCPMPAAPRDQRPRLDHHRRGRRRRYRRGAAPVDQPTGLRLRPWGLRS
jgi:hypothetical protein